MVSPLSSLPASDLCGADSVNVNVQRTDEETGRLTRKQVMPSSIVEQWLSDCAAFNISQHKDKMRLVDVSSYWDVFVYLHDKNQRKIHMQLSKFVVLDGIYVATCTEQR